MAARRKKTDPTGLGLYPEWSWTWPVNTKDHLQPGIC